MSDRNAGSSVSSETRQHTGSEDSGIASLVAIPKLSGVAVITEHLKHLSGLSLPINALTLARLARQDAVKARSTTSRVSRFAQAPLPRLPNFATDTSWSRPTNVQTTTF